MKSAVCTPDSRIALSCQIGAVKWLRWNADQIAQARRQPVAFGGEKLPISFLKHADEQTVLALWTVLEAIETADLQDRSFDSWGVIASPSFFGRLSIAQSVRRYHQEGAWGISPQLIPHQSLHAMSGTISQALRIHGPNFGVGAEPCAGPDALLLAAAMLYDGQLPGLWLALTGYETEWIPAADGQHPTAPACQALAVALTPDENASGTRLRFGSAGPQAEKESPLEMSPAFSLELLAEEMSDPCRLPEGRWRLSDSHWIEFEAVLGVEKNLS
ncbi:MAG: hypothetical protein HYX68_08270 [Planctomycetes bacterium]|nr:hypothetical protein [Planctomycetota bacterium]